MTLVCVERKISIFAELQQTGYRSKADNHIYPWNDAGTGGTG